MLAFPQKRLREVNARLAELFADWTPDPVRIEGESAELAFKYQGFCHEASANVKVEVQIVPALIGAFWEVEHAAIYKPTLELKGVDRDEEMKECIRDVYQALRAFEGEFEEVVARALAKT